MKLFKNISPAETLATSLALAVASVSPLAFDVSATGSVTLHELGQIAILPAVAIWLLLVASASAMKWRRLAGAGLLAIGAGILGTAAMEVVRITGFRVFDAMPGSMPMLIGVLLTDRFMEGPDLWSNLLGWGDHFWNGIGVAFIYVVLFGRMRWWVGVIYAFLIATVFMMGPVMNIIGAGHFGQEFAPVKFPLTVYGAHIAYGAVIGWLVQRSALAQGHLLCDLFGIRIGGLERIVDASS